jgi:hypothetical protein
MIQPQGASVGRENPLALLEAEQVQMANFHHLIHDVLLPASSTEGQSEFTPFQRGVVSQTETATPSPLLCERAEQERHVLSVLMRHVNMDPTLLLSQSSLPEEMDGNNNWLECLHSSVEQLVPTAFLKVYRGPPSDHEWNLMTAEYNHCQGTTDGAELVLSMDDREMAEEVLLKRYRDRGWIFKSPTMYHFNVLVIDAVQHCTSFAIPNQLILDKIGSLYGPVVEVGAGTGYWAALLKSRGVDVVAYDKAPPGANQGASQFFSSRYTSVLQGDASSQAFWKTNRVYLSTRSLLMVWPNNPDKIDNPEFYHGREEIPPVWDVDCLTHYMASGGQTVIYVGEREDNITTLPDYPSDCGICSSRRFQLMLKEHFHLVEQVEIPSWYWTKDDATIWRRKKKA